jgi:DIM1 family U5 snRNP protein
MTMDEHLYSASPTFPHHQLRDNTYADATTDFNGMYELYDACTVMFFWRNKHIQVDFGTGNNNKINFEIQDKQELVDIMEVAYKAASKGKGLAVSPKDYSTKWLY